MARMESLRKNTDASAPEGLRGGCCGWQQQGMRHTRIATVATSRVVSVSVLLMLRALLLLSLVFGGIWLAWRLSRGERFDEEPPPFLCLPDWSYAVTALYFLMATLACLRLTTASSSGSAPPEDTASSNLASAATLFALEISIVFQTIAVFITWIEHGKHGKPPERAVMSTLALGAVVTDLLLNRSRIEAKHSWILLVFLLAWAVAQVAWVHTEADHSACYEAFDARGMGSLLSAALAVAVVVALVFAYAALCAQRDRLTSRLGGSLEPDYTGPDVEEDVGQESVVTRTLSLPPATLRAPPISERACVVNPIFAGSGSRMQRKWPSGNTTTNNNNTATNNNNNVSCENRASLASIETEMSSGEDLEPGWPPDAQADPHAASGGGSGGGGGGGGGGGDSGGGGGGGRHSRGPSIVAPIPEGGGGAPRDRGAAAAGGRGLTAHPSSWAGYGGAAAWVRSSRDATPPTRGGKGGARRGPSRF